VKYIVSKPNKAKGTENQHINKVKQKFSGLINCKEAFELLRLIEAKL
jgi:hypothetical protein